MKLVGSRTGAYEFWVRLPCGFEVWFGEGPDSDVDILLDEDEPEPVTKDPYRLDIFRGKPTGPYVEDGKLHTPEGFDYLLYPLAVKTFMRNLSHLLHRPAMAEVLNKDRKKVGDLYTDYRQVSVGFLSQVLGNQQKIYLKDSFINKS